MKYNCMSMRIVPVGKLRTGYRSAMSGENTPHLNPLPQGERKQEKGWIPAFARMTDYSLALFFQNDNFVASFDKKGISGI
jgi:hypothetical protein